jgi:hypothetical protein
MLLLAFFKAETVVGRIFKTSMCGQAVIVLYLGLTAQPPSSVLIAVSLSVLVMLCVHGVLHNRRVPPASAACIAEVIENERQIRVVGGGIELTLSLPSRTLTVRRMPRHFISSDAPGEFHRLRAGRFGWPFQAHAASYGAGQACPDEAIAFDEPANAMRWAGKAAGKNASTGSADGDRLRTPPAGSLSLREVRVQWLHPGHGERLLFTVAGPASKYEALERAFVVFAEWIEEDDEARRAIERRQQAEAWQRNWEATRLADEIEEARRKAERDTESWPEQEFPDVTARSLPQTSHMSGDSPA